jgi:NAD-dependent dihydropyrimidine dehydrogenase PreA subunit
MGEFIKVEIDSIKCSGISGCGQCITVCSVNVFQRKASKLVLIEDNEDECTLCNLCLEVCAPGAIAIHKLYE